MQRRVRSHVRAGIATAMLAIAVGAGADAPQLPTEFRIFAAGWNETTKGKFLFDEAAADAVMASYAKHGVDVMIDLEHLSLDDEPSPDPTSKDARGWLNLELRATDAGPELWAVKVSWTPDGAARLTEKRQRYVSPAFLFEKDSKRIAEVVNVAICAMPATHEMPPLVAASRRGEARDVRKLSTGAAFSDVEMALRKALSDRFPPPAEQGVDCFTPGPWLVDVFDATCVFELNAKLYEVAYAYDGSVATLSGEPREVRRAYAPIEAKPAPAPSAPPATNTTTATRRAGAATKLAAGGKSMDPKQISAAIKAIKDSDSTAALEILEQMLVAAAGGDAADAGAGGDAGAAAASDAPPAPKKEDEELAAAGRMALSITGKTNAGEAMTELARRSKIAVDVEQREATLAADNKKLEATERRALVGELVKLGMEIPATAWKDDKGTEPCDRLAGEPIDALRTRVAQLAKASGKKLEIKPPTGGAGAHGLTAAQLAKCTKLGVDPAKFAANLAAMTGK